jgi:hypothetical protein
VQQVAEGLHVGEKVGCAWECSCSHATKLDREESIYSNDNKLTDVRAAPKLGNFQVTSKSKLLPSFGKSVVVGCLPLLQHEKVR